MPLYIQILISLITGSVVFCLVLGLAGYLFNRKNPAIVSEPLIPGNRALSFFAYFYTIFLGLLFALITAGNAIAGGIENAPDDNLYQNIISILFQVALYLPAILTFFAIPARECPRTPLRRKLSWVVFFLLLMLIPSHLMEAFQLAEWIARKTGAPELQDVVTSIRDGSPDTRMLMIFMAVIVAPITEEIYFRGTVYNILKKWSGAVSAAMASALFFSVVHGSLTQFIPLTLFALIQCWAYERARSLWLPILLHMLFNGISCLYIIFFMNHG